MKSIHHFIIPMVGEFLIENDPDALDNTIHDDINKSPSGQYAIRHAQNTTKVVFIPQDWKDLYERPGHPNDGFNVPSIYDL